MPSDRRKGRKMRMMKLVLYPFANKNVGIEVGIRIDARNLPQVRSFQSMDTGSTPL